jgi:hypothetical protein
MEIIYLNLTAKNKIKKYALKYGNASFYLNWFLIHLVFKIAKFICSSRAMIKLLDLFRVCWCLFEDHFIKQLLV